MDAPTIVRSPITGEEWVFTVSYGGTSQGYHMSQFDINGNFIRHILPNSFSGNTSGASWPYAHTTGWAATWPQMWLDNSKGLGSGIAYIWVKHSQSFLFSLPINLTTGIPSAPVLEGVHAGGSNAFTDHWQIIAQDNNNIMCCYGIESNTLSYANGAQCHVMASGAASIHGRDYTGVTKYIRQCTAGLNFSLTAASHNQSYIIPIGINAYNGRVYIHRKGADDVITVFQLSQADGTGPTRWYRAWYNSLASAADTPNTGTYILNYVGQFAIPDAINTASGNQTTSYQVQFSTPSANGEPSVPLYLTRGGHWGAWNYGGAQIIPWQSDWIT